jgi:hypothetical protein
MKLNLFAFCVLGLFAQPGFAQNFEIRTYAEASNYGVHDAQGDGLIDFTPYGASSNIVSVTGTPLLQAFNEFSYLSFRTWSVMQLRRGESAIFETSANWFVEAHSSGPYSALVDAYTSNSTITQTSGLQPNDVEWSSRTSWERRVWNPSQSQWVADLPPVVVVRGGNASNFQDVDSRIVTARYYTGVYLWTLKTSTTVSVVPEPTSMAVLSLGSLVLCLRGRARRC